MDRVPVSLEHDRTRTGEKKEDQKEKDRSLTASAIPGASARSRIEGREGRAMERVVASAPRLRRRSSRSLPAPLVLRPRPGSGPRRRARSERPRTSHTPKVLPRLPYSFEPRVHLTPESLPPRRRAPSASTAILLLRERDPTAHRHEPSLDPPRPPADTAPPRRPRRRASAVSPRDERVHAERGSSQGEPGSGASGSLPRSIDRGGSADSERRAGTARSGGQLRDAGRRPAPTVPTRTTSAPGGGRGAPRRERAG